MTSDFTGGVKWRQATVLIRGDIFSLAKERGIDISSECNRALADTLGIEYAQQKIPELPRENPVIIAKDGAGGTGRDGRAGKHLSPVMNAEDPAIRTHILKSKKEPVLRAPAVHPPAQVDKQAEAEKVAKAPVETVQRSVKLADVQPTGKKGTKSSSGKKGKDDLIRQFVAKRIARTDPGDGENRVPKDELYQIFTRWWKSNAGKSAIMPDKRAFTIFLKNRLVMEEGAADGVQYWNNIKLR